MQPQVGNSAVSVTKKTVETDEDLNSQEDGNQKVRKKLS